MSVILRSSLSLDLELILTSVCLVSLFCFRICLGRNSEYVYKEEIISWDTIFLGEFSSFFSIVVGGLENSVKGPTECL